MDTFEAKIQFDPNAAHEILNLIAKIEESKGRWSVLENQHASFLNELRTVATIESVGSSTRIEGATLSDNEVKKLIAKLEISKLETRDAQEVAGYYETLEIILESFRDIDLTENYIKQLHGIVLKHSKKDDRQRGDYKQLTNKVVVTYPDGTQKVIFKTTEPHLVPEEMRSVIAWTNRRLEDRIIHPLIVIGLFIYEFLSIHPFHDGNGRLSRLLTTFLLLKKEYNFIKYISFEHLIEERKKSYYAALMAGHQHRNTEVEIIDDWMLFFLKSLQTLTTKLELKLQQTELRKASHLNPRQKRILTFVKANGPCKVGEIHDSFSETSIHTLKKDLKHLVQIAALEKIGERKATVYRVD